jgi:hypothetical protein
MKSRKLGLLLGLVVIAVAVVGTAAASTQSGGGSSSIPVIQDSQLQASFTETTDGATPTSTSRTIPHWFGTSVNGDNGVTYGYTMAGADPNTCSGAACDSTIQADITPINVIINYGGSQYVFNGSDTVNPTLASPVFATNDYGSTPWATTRPTCTYNSGPGGIVNGSFCGGPGGTLSQDDAGVPLQLEDATMRAQFNLTGAGSTYHLRLNPHVLPAVTINVPQNQGTLLQSGRGVIFADVDIGWWSSQIKNLENQADPTHLAVYLTNSVFLYEINDPSQCCVLGYHGTQAVGGGSVNSNGNAKLQTFAWASWAQPGIYSRPDHGTDWALQDIHPLSHEIAEWGDDPFVNNLVEPWLTPTAPQYGCTGILETGDPVVGIGFAKGTNTYEQGPNPNGTQSADGYYHPEDEVFLPWFMRTSPNTTSEPTQSPSGNIGRYSLMGDLNPFPGFRQPATGC